MAALVLVLAILSATVQPVDGAGWRGSSHPIPFAPQGDKPYCLLYSASSVLGYWLPEGNDNGPLTPGRLVDDYKDWFDPTWQEGTPADPIKLYEGIHQYYHVDTLPLARYDLGTALGYVRQGYPTIIYLKVMTIGDQVYTDAFVAYGVGTASDVVYLVSSAYGYRSFSSQEIADMWDGWAMVIKPTGVDGDRGVEHVGAASEAISMLTRVNQRLLSLDADRRAHRPVR